jgi:YD repeat-containing protein
VSFEAGRILLPNEAPWLADFEHELLAFPYGGYDDQVDALLLFLTSPDSGATTRTFDAAGNVSSSTDARGLKTTYQYDALNRPIQATYADGKTVTWQYD